MILLVSNSRDFATDFVVSQLRARDAPYVRIDLDLLDQDRVFLNPTQQTLTIVREFATTGICGDEIRSIYFRAPTHLRESSGGRWAPDELLKRHQWAAFARSLMVFDGARWVNHPTETYRAENKPYQLMLASRLGFLTPQTLITNSVPQDGHEIWGGNHFIAVKALDSFLLQVGPEQDAFFYTQRVEQGDLTDTALSAMPVIAQRYFSDKIDLRVTIVGEDCFAALVLVEGKGISGDWRLAKDCAVFEPYELPEAIRSQCVGLVKALGLVFGAIDLVKAGDDFYFLEVNPTGEWAWLVTQCGMPIDRALADVLLR